MATQQTSLFINRADSQSICWHFRVAVCIPWAEVLRLMQEVRRKQGVSGLSQGALARERRVTSYGEENLSNEGHSGEMDFQTFDVS